MIGIFTKISQLADSATSKLRVRSALNPILWLCAIAMPICFATAYVFKGMPALCFVLIGFGCLPLAVACLAFIGFAIYRPEKLQSEEYQIRHESLQLIQQKAGQVTVVPTSIVAIANPLHPLSLPSSEGDSNA